MLKAARYVATYVKMKPNTVLCLLRNDLRYHDNPVLHEANINADFVLPVYCFDTQHFKGTWNFNFPKTGPFRAQFLVDSVSDLRNTLQSKNSNLVVRHRAPKEAVLNLIEKCKDFAPVTKLVYQKEVTYEETKVEEELSAICSELKIEVVQVWGSTMHHIQDIPFKINNIPDTFTQFKNPVEARCKVRPLLEMPSQLKSLPPVDLDPGHIPELEQLGVTSEAVDHRTAFPFGGGESAGLERLREYLWETHAVTTYKETRNGLVGKNYSTKLSPWLALGCVSPRIIYSQIKKFEAEKISNQSTYWVLFELMWRDYFKFVCYKFGNKVFQVGGILEKDYPWSQDMDKFRRWAEGRTGVPFVDANMRELKLTGWMSNRGRQNVASFLVKDLGLDWRLRAEWFEYMLLDHDVCSNYGNWNYAAGVGNDPRQGRKFNMVKQAVDYDPKGDYVRLWVEELGRIKDGRVQAPWTLGSVVGVEYPRPMVVAPEWGKHVAKCGKQSVSSGGAQKGIDFYFKGDRKAGEQAGKGPKKPPLKGGRIQY